MLKNIWSNFLKWLCTLELAISVVSLAGMVLLNTVEIFRRTFLSASISWVQEITVVLLIWFTFMGFSKLTYEKADIYIDVVIARLPAAIKSVIEVFLLGISIAFCIAFFINTYQLLEQQSASNMVMIVSKLPQSLKTLPCLICMGTMTLIYIDLLIKQIASAIHYFSKKGGTQA